MGRYAFFNTGLEYKFGYGIQSSNDMVLFGGVERMDTDEPIHEWLAERDIPVIKRVLEAIEDAWNVEGVGSIYESSVEGSYKLSADLVKACFEPLNIFYRYRLGCLILHQLLYQPALSVRYEL